MTDDGNVQPMVVRTERGLSIRGTRITLYDIMDHLKQDWPRKLIRDWFDLTDEQIDGVLRYIDEHCDAVEEEYRQVLRQAEEIRRYWEERNRERLAEIAAMPPKPEYAAVHAKLAAARAKRKQRDDHAD